MIRMSGKAYPGFLVMASCALAVGLSNRLSAESPGEKVLLAKAQSLQAHGHLELAIQTWQQVLLSDPTDREALLGIAKADMQLGKTEEAQRLTQRLRDLGATSADLRQMEAMPHVEAPSVRLKQARSLAQQGNYAGSVKVYRDLYPDGPPAGDTALEFYETEAAVPELRRQAVDRLRQLAAQFSADPRYAIVLGRILTYDPKTRAEGVAMLSHYDASPEAQQALRQASSWNGDAKKAAAAASTAAANPIAAREPSADPMEASAYRALNSGQLDQAEQQFQALLAKSPHNARALSGMGYVYMKRGNFAQAVDYLEKARAAGAAKLEGAISTARFWSRMAQAGAEQKSGDAQTAARDYRDALSLKPTSPDAEQALASALMQAGNQRDAVAILKREVGANPGNEAAWRNLFQAQAQMADWREALATRELIPKSIEIRLETDPDYLRFLIQAYQATGRKLDADGATEKALALPFPNHGRDLPPDKQLQYAELLMTVRRFEPALRLYRQVVAVDPGNTGAWRALVAAEHQLNRDEDAIADLRGMPRSAYDQSQNDPGFLALLGSIYQTRDQLGSAQKYLEKALSVAASPQPGIELQLANVYVAQGELQKAYTLYRRELDRNPRSPDAWRGMVTTLHQSKRDREALRQLDEMPDSVRLALEQDTAYLQTVASIQDATGQDKAALQTFDQLAQVYLDQRLDEPADMQIQYGWLLLKAGDDRRLYSLVSQLAQVPSLTKEQQAAFHNLWASWSVRRATSSLARGDLQQAVVILETAAQAFPGNIDIYNALAGAYLKAGQPKRAVAIYASLDLRHGSLAQYHGAIGAALAARDLKQAESWLQLALGLYKDDPDILKMAAQYEQARGDTGRAAAYYRAALDAMGPATQGEIFSHTASPGSNSDDPGRDNAPTRELMRLLAPRDATSQTTDERDHGSVRKEAAVSWRDGPRAMAPTLGDFDTAEGRDHTSIIPNEDAPAQAHRYSGRGEAEDVVRSQGSRIAPSRLFNDYAQREIPPSEQRRMDADDTGRATQSLGDLTAVEDAQDATVLAPAPIVRTNFELPPRRAYIEAQDEETGKGLSSARKTNPPTNPPSGDSAGESNAEKLQDAVRNLEETPRAERQLPLLGKERPDNGRSLDNNSAGTGQDLGAQFTASPPFLGAGPSGVASVVLPPLTGAAIASQAPLTPREQIQQQLAVLEGESSSWTGGTSSLDYRSGQPGFDRLAVFSGQAEASGMLGPGVRTTFIVAPVLLDAGQATGTETLRQGTLPVNSVPYIQSAAGTAGEFQLQTSNFGARFGSTPRGFLVQNYTGGLYIHPASAHFSMEFSRDPVLDTQLSFAGLRDEGTATATSVGNTWGGVISNSGEIHINSGDQFSGWYVQAGGQYLTGVHVANNERIDGDGGAYWTAWRSPEYGSLIAGMNFFGMHYERNLRYFTYGQGGYFSPGAYLLAAVPLTFNGHYGTRFHYRASGSLGMQAFQEDSAPYFPLDAAYQAAQGNPTYPERTSVGGNYNLDAEGSYAIADHWYVGGYMNFNNSRDYASDKVGFFFRYVTRPQPLNQEIGPTGLFPVQGMRPLQTP
jgi:cellulose synthase operon protein C